MSIASEIQALQQDKRNIATAITNKGITVPSGSGFDSFASLISSIAIGEKIAYGLQWLLQPTQIITFSFDFEPKAVVFTCVIDETYIDTYLPVVTDKDVYSNFSLISFPISVSGGTYNFNSYIRYKKDEPNSAEIFTVGGIVTYMLSITYNQTSEKWDVSIGVITTSSSYFTFAGTTNVVTQGIQGIPYHIVALGD